MDQSPFFNVIRSPFRFRLYLLARLPAAFFSGLGVEKADDDECIVTIPYKWFTRNPFRSTYFACLGMAAEMCTGILAMAHVYKSNPRISMLVIGLEGHFTKKATGRTSFRCNDGAAIREAIAKSRATGEGQTVNAHAVGTDKAGEIVAGFTITWSFKVVGQKPNGESLAGK